MGAGGSLRGWPVVYQSHRHECAHTVRAWTTRPAWGSGALCPKRKTMLSGDDRAELRKEEAQRLPLPPKATPATGPWEWVGTCPALAGAGAWAAPQARSPGPAALHCAGAEQGPGGVDTAQMTRAVLLSRVPLAVTFGCCDTALFPSRKERIVLLRRGLPPMSFPLLEQG